MARQTLAASTSNGNYDPDMRRPRPTAVDSAAAEERSDGVTPPELPAGVAALLDRFGCVRSQVMLPSSRPGRRLWQVQFARRATTIAGSERKTVRPDVVAPVETVYVKQFEVAAAYRRETMALGQAPDGMVPALLASIRDDQCVVMAGVDGLPLDKAPPGRHAEWMAASLRTVLACSGLAGPWDPDPPTVLTVAQELIAEDLTKVMPHAAYGLRDCLANSDAVPCHGDISPSNVLVDKEGRAVLFDFEFYGPGNLIADVAAVVLTPSLSVSLEVRLGLLVDGVMQARRLGCSTDRDRVAGAIVLWAAQCGSWYQARKADDVNAGHLAEKAMSLSRLALISLQET